MTQFIGIALALGMIYIVYRQLFSSNKPTRKSFPNAVFPASWRVILLEEVKFYQDLSAVNRSKFEARVLDFLLNCKVTGIKTTVADADKLLIAASAIIPIFNFPDWQYRTIDEVLLYPDTFNTNHQFEGADRNILGMVGEGYMQGKMILSKKALYQGFTNETDKKNTAIHEFVHLIDKADGNVDGIPEVLLKQQYVLPWIELITTNIREIKMGRSDINPYAATNKQEFLAVISEYFFERPELLKSKHPKLYSLLEEMYGKKSD